MPVSIIFRASDSPTYPAPGSWRKGDAVQALPRDFVFGPESEVRPPKFVRCNLEFANTPDPEWIQDAIDSQGGRRTVGLTAAEVDSIVATDPVWGEKSYNSRGQFIARLEQKKTAGALAQPASE